MIWFTNLSYTKGCFCFHTMAKWLGFSFTRGWSHEGHKQSTTSTGSSQTRQLEKRCQSRPIEVWTVRNWVRDIKSCTMGSIPGTAFKIYQHGERSVFYGENVVVKIKWHREFIINSQGARQKGKVPCRASKDPCWKTEHMNPHYGQVFWLGVELISQRLLF